MNVQHHARHANQRGEAERGASLVEYALLLALIVVVCVAAVAALGGTTDESVNEYNSTLSAHQ